MTTEETIRKLRREILLTNITLLLVTITMAFFAIKIKTSMSTLTEKTSEIAQKVNVEFQTETNNLFWIRSVRLK